LQRQLSIPGQNPGLVMQFLSGMLASHRIQGQRGYLLEWLKTYLEKYDRVYPECLAA